MGGILFRGSKATVSRTLNSRQGSPQVIPDQLTFPAVTIKQHILHLELDTDNSYTAGRLPFPPTSTQEPLHIGGVPANLKILKLPVWKSFFGCLKDIQVNRIPVPVTEAVEVQGTVSLNGCPDH
ncbi:laminin subunit alpha-3-like [Pteropus vampyrus]|uniref:Laminin subunit alpha-3-like n=1 Tax=Pteropus vampyrus TaxID=132908 RepID=A0A6P6CGN1_PTEVA|nr:laminin subunit alpha-3-like [Pteropus vampyrus]